MNPHFFTAPFLLRLPEWSVGLLSLAACLAPSCGKYFCIGILSKEEIFFIRRVMKNVYPSPWEACLPGAIMI